MFGITWMRHGKDMRDLETLPLWAINIIWTMVTGPSRYIQIFSFQSFLRRAQGVNVNSYKRPRHFSQSFEFIATTPTFLFKSHSSVPSSSGHFTKWHHWHSNKSDAFLYRSTKEANRHVVKEIQATRKINCWINFVTSLKWKSCLSRLSFPGLALFVQLSLLTSPPYCLLQLGESFIHHPLQRAFEFQVRCVSVPQQQTGRGIILFAPAGEGVQLLLPQNFLWVPGCSLFFQGNIFLVKKLPPIHCVIVTN